MTLTSDQRERVAAAFSLTVAVAVTAGLAVFSVASPTPDTAKLLPKPVAAMRFKPVSPVKPPPAAAIPIQTTTAPKDLTPKVVPTAVPPTQPVVETPVIESSTNPLTEQPALQLPPVNTTPEVLPPLPSVAAPTNSAEQPAKPPADYVPPEPTYTEKPGGEVLVLGLLVGADGKVLDTRILVPPHDALGALSYAMIARKQTVSGMDPPLAPGETRWLEVRILFPINKPGILP